MACIESLRQMGNFNWGPVYVTTSFLQKHALIDRALVKNAPETVGCLNRLLRLFASIID